MSSSLDPFTPPEPCFLIVDADDSARSAVRSYLESFELKNFLEAPRLKDALDLFNSNPIRAIICNRELPGANGLTFLKLIKSQERFREIVFILTADSGTLQPELALQASAGGADGCLVKPFLGDKLKALLGRALTAASG